MDLCEITEEIQLSVVAPRIFVSHQALEYLRTMGKETAEHTAARDWLGWMVGFCLLYGFAWHR